MHLEATNNALQFPHPISINSHFINANQPGWQLDLHIEIIKTGANLAYLQLVARHFDQKKQKEIIVWMINYVWGDLTKNKLPFEFETRKAPPMPPISECFDFHNPFKSKFGSYKLQLIPKGTNPWKSKTRIPAYMGWKDGVELDLLHATLFADLFTDHRMFATVNKPRPQIMRAGPKTPIPRGKIGIRTSGTITMAIHFMRPPTPGTKFFLMDTVVAMYNGVGDYEIQMYDPQTKELIGLARQVQHIWAIRNDDDVKDGIEVKL